MDWRYGILGLIVGLVIILGITTLFFSWPWGYGGSDGDETDVATSIPMAENVEIVEAWIVDPDDPDPMHADLEVGEPIDLEADDSDVITRIYDSGGSLLVLVLEEDGDPFDGDVTVEYPVALDEGETLDTKTTQSDGGGVFGFQLNLVGGTELTGVADRHMPFTISVSTEEGLVRDLSLHVIDLLGTGSVVTDMLEDEQEVRTELEIDPRLIAAVEDFCGFGANEVDKAVLRINDQPRFQVTLLASGHFRESGRVIPAGQPIWVLVSYDEEECFINPPCGNPEVPKGKLPPEPTVRREVPSNTPSPTPPVGNTATPPAEDTPTNTPPERPTATPTPKNTPTNTPQSTSTPPQTPAPTNTLVPPCCPTAEFTPPAEGGTPIRPTATPRPTRTPLPEPTQDRPDPVLPTPVSVF